MEKEETKPDFTLAERQLFMQIFELAERHGLPDAKYVMKRSIDSDGFTKIEITITRFTVEGKELRTEMSIKKYFPWFGSDWEELASKVKDGA